LRRGRDCASCDQAAWSTSREIRSNLDLMKIKILVEEKFKELDSDQIEGGEFEF